jgi:glucose uptake protein GlcU
MKTRGLLDHIEQASHIADGMNIPFSEAMGMVRAAHELATEKAQQDDQPTTTNNVVYGVDFGRR